MGRAFTLAKEITGVDSTNTFLLLTAGSDKPFRVLDIQVSEKSTDGQSLIFTAGHVSDVASAAGTAVTSDIQLVDPNSGSVATTALEKLTTEPTTYTPGNQARRAVNTAAGFDHNPIPELFPVVPGGKGFGLKLDEAPAAATDLHVLIACEEI